MRTVELTFPDKPEINEPYRGKSFLVNYEIIIDEAGGARPCVYVGNEEVKGYTARWAIDQVRNGRPLEDLAENIDGSQPSWPRDVQWD